MARSVILALTLLGGISSLFGRPQRTDPDAAVLAQLKKAGSSLSKPHKIEFFLYFPSEAVANEARARVKQAGFDVEVRPAAKGPDWLCFATKTMVPQLPTLQKIRREFDALAASFGGKYDGWGTGVGVEK